MLPTRKCFEKVSLIIFQTDLVGISVHYRLANFEIWKMEITLKNLFPGKQYMIYWKQKESNTWLMKKEIWLIQ